MSRRATGTVVAGNGLGRAVEDAVRTLNGIFRDVDLFSRRSLLRFGVTGPQLWALRILSRSGPASMGVLASRLYLHVSTVTGIVARLRKAGLLVRRRSAGDHRVVHVTVTPAGRRLAGRAPEPPRSVFARALSDLPPARVEGVRRALHMIALLMGGLQPPTGARALRPAGPARES